MKTTVGTNVYKTHKLRISGTLHTQKTRLGFGAQNPKPYFRVSFTSSRLGGGDGVGGSSFLFGHKSAEMSMTVTAAAAATPIFLQRRFGCCLECARSTLAPPSPSLACSSPSSPWSSSSQCGLSMSMKKQTRKDISNPARGVFVRASGSTAVADPEGLQVLLPSELGFQFPEKKKSILRV
jgi:hypothetical protein